MVKFKLDSLQSVADYATWALESKEYLMAHSEPGPHPRDGSRSPLLVSERWLNVIVGNITDLHDVWHCPKPYVATVNGLRWELAPLLGWIDAVQTLVFERFEVETATAQQATDNTERLAALKNQMRPIAANLRNAVLKLEGCVGRYQRLGLEIDGLRELVSRLTQERDALRQEMAGAEP
jgi:hypothetical protein